MGRCRLRAAPRATHVSGSSATHTRSLSSFVSRSARPCNRAPPPARQMPMSIRSATISGGISSRAYRTVERFANLHRCDFDGFRQPGDQVSAAHFECLLRLHGKRRTYAPLDLLRNALADEQAVFVAEVLDHVLIHLVASYTQGS